MSAVIETKERPTLVDLSGGDLKRGVAEVLEEGGLDNDLVDELNDEIDDDAIDGR